MDSRDQYYKEYYTFKHALVCSNKTNKMKLYFRHHHTDGAYFGTGFPHMLFMVHPEYRPKRPANQVIPLLVPFTNK